MDIQNYFQIRSENRLHCRGRSLFEMLKIGSELMAVEELCGIQQFLHKFRHFCLEANNSRILKQKKATLQHAMAQGVCKTEEAENYFSTLQGE